MAAFAAKRDPGWVTGGCTRGERAPGGQLQRVLRRPAVGGAGDGRGRPDRRAHRRLAGRADHAAAGQGRDSADGPGYASDLPRPARAGARACVERGIKIVANAGGLDPAGVRGGGVRAWPPEPGLRPVVAHVEGDDLLGRLAELTAAGHELANSRYRRAAGRRPGSPRSPRTPIWAGCRSPTRWRGRSRRGGDRPGDRCGARRRARGIWRFGWSGDDLDAAGRRGGRRPRASSAAARRLAATTPSSARSRISSGPGSRWPNSPPTGRR